MNRAGLSRQEQRLLKTADAVDASTRDLINAPPDANLVLVPRYVGMSRQDAVRFRFGTDEVPAGLTAVLLTNALPPVGVPYEWWSMDRGSAEFEAAAEACREEARVGL